MVCRTVGEPVLHEGDDFSKTDLEIVLVEQDESP